MTSQKMTICRLPVKGDVGKFYLKKMFWKTFGGVLFFLLFAVISALIFIEVGYKYGQDSTEYANFNIIWFIMLFVCLLSFIIWIINTNVEANCIQFNFVTSSATDIWVFNCYNPKIFSLYKKSPNRKIVKLGIYGVIFSLFHPTSCLVESAKTLSYTNICGMVDYCVENFSESTYFGGLGLRICGVSNLIVHKNTITFKTVEQSEDGKRYTRHYRISKNFTNSEELIRVLENLNNLT